MSDADKGFEWCPIDGWVAEIVTRMHEAHAVGSKIVNLSWTHPRGYIPTQIVRRPQVRSLLKEWEADTTKTPPSAPPPKVWIPKGWPKNTDWDTCPLRPFLDEITVRESEAVEQAHRAGRPFPLLDMTSWNPKGGFPPAILQRLSRRSNPTWRKQTAEEINRLEGEANKATSFAKTQAERSEAVDDPSKLIAASKELSERAALYRAQAKWLIEELW